MAIRSDTDPKSASPRSRTSKGELEQYGVWVKAEPQDVIEEIAVPGSADFDFDPLGETASLPEESFLTEDEERLLGTFDADFEAPSGYSPDDSGPLPDIEDMPPLEESMQSSIDISLEDIESARPSLSPIHPGVEIDMDTLEGLDSPSGQPDMAAGTIEDVSSEFLDLSEETGSAEQSRQGAASGFGAELDDVTSEFLDLEESERLPGSADPSVDFEPLDIDLHFDDSSASSQGGGHPSPETGFEAVTEFDDFLSSDDAMTDSPLESVDDGFDDVSAVERELSAPVPAAGAKARPSSAGNQDLSTEILLKIAQELASIRGELVSLKTKIGGAMTAPESPSKKPSAAAPGEEDESGPTGGFFDEEEDETIALTGDELDNILNTADFTEETAETQLPIDIEAEPLVSETGPFEDSSLLDETLLPESGDYSSGKLPSPAAKPAIEEIRIGQADSVDEIGLEYLEGENDELGLVAEEGLAPMTPAPEDTSYLEAAETLDMGDVHMSDAPLVEPDLSDFDLEPEEFEPRLEIDEELPLASLDAEAELEAAAGSNDLTLGIPAGPGYATEESAAEAEFLEPVNEIEETNYSEINLHEEGLESSSAGEPAELEEIDALSDTDFAAPLYSQTPAQRREVPPIEEEEDLVLGPETETSPLKAPAREAPVPRPAPKVPAASDAISGSPMADGDRLKSEIKSVLSYLDKLLDSLPEEKIEEFANSEYFDTYKKLFEELGLV